MEADGVPTERCALVVLVNIPPTRMLSVLQRCGTRRICALEYDSEETSGLLALRYVLKIVVSRNIPDGPGSVVGVEVAARLASAEASQARATPLART